MQRIPLVSMKGIITYPDGCFFAFDLQKQCNENRQAPCFGLPVLHDF
jgi:hypothetical protein